ncbi:MAG: ParA family protein [Cyclobacteriaceae bacterium]|nr:ParA family protein [Cyclobacteriaceae bacterium]
MKETISIVNQKGGTGKTTTSVNLASAMVSEGMRVLVIDFDPQGNLSYCFGVDPDGDTIANVLKGDISLKDAIVVSESVHIVPANISLADLEISLVAEIGREFYLKKALDTVEGYDYIIIDCPPSLSLLAINALVASDAVVVPMQMEVMSLQGLNQIQSTIQKINSSYNKSIYIKGILPVMVDHRRNLDGEVEGFIKENYNIPLFESRIRTNVRASEAPSFGKSVISYAPKSNSAMDYINFASELIKL